jgi:hypothetical protein
MIVIYYIDVFKVASVCFDRLISCNCARIHHSNIQVYKLNYFAVSNFCLQYVNIALATQGVQG